MITGKCFNQDAAAPWQICREMRFFSACDRSGQIIVPLRKRSVKLRSECNFPLTNEGQAGYLLGPTIAIMKGMWETLNSLLGLDPRSEIARKNVGILIARVSTTVAHVAAQLAQHLNWTKVHQPRSQTGEKTALDNDGPLQQHPCDDPAGVTTSGV